MTEIVLPTFREEDAAGVAQPHAVGGPAVEADVGGKSIGLLKDFAGLSGAGCVVDDQPDTFPFGEVADDFGVDPWDGLELSRPVALVVGPCEPGCGVRFPLGGHAVAEGCGEGTFDS